MPRSLVVVAMATAKTLFATGRTLPRYQHPSITTRHLPSIQHSQRRTFFPNPLSNDKPEHLTATRTVPYPASTVYSIIADVSSYSTFVPFCTSSQVTHTSQPDESGRTWPEQATLTVGFNADISESFASRVYCLPERVVEAVAGRDAETSLSEAEVPHHSPRKDGDAARTNGVLSHLRTRWEIRPKGEGSTEARLSIEYAFANPLYAVMSRAAAPRIAERMIEAFERRIGEVVGKRK